MRTGKQNNASAAGQFGTAVENSQQLCFLSTHVIGVHHCIDRGSRSLGKRLDPGDDMNVSLKKLAFVINDNTAF